MKATLVITGLNEVYAALRTLTPAAAAEAATILERRAEAAASHIREAYPVGKAHKRPVGPSGTLRPGGTLKSKVRVDQKEISRAGASIRIVSAAPHAHLYEFGTARGGRAHPTFVPEVQRARKLVLADQVALLERQGFTVSGGLI